MGERDHGFSRAQRARPVGLRGLGPGDVARGRLHTAGCRQRLLSSTPTSMAFSGIDKACPCPKGWRRSTSPRSCSPNSRPTTIRPCCGPDRRLRREPARRRGGLRLRPRSHPRRSRADAGSQLTTAAPAATGLQRGGVRRKEGTMNAIVQTGYGSSDVMEYRQVDEPVPGEGHARPSDGCLAGGRRVLRDEREALPGSGSTSASRTEAGLRPGNRFRGGRRVRRRRRERVSTRRRGLRRCRGSCAEFALAKAASIAHKPRNLTFVQSAAVPTSPARRCRPLQDHGKVRPGHKVLINGASGASDRSPCRSPRRSAPR